MADLVILGRTPGLRPPLWSLLIAARVRVRRLLLRLDSFDPGLGDELARRLLAVLESLLVEVPNRIGIANLDTPT